MSHIDINFFNISKEESPHNRCAQSPTKSRAIPKEPTVFTSNNIYKLKPNYTGGRSRLYSDNFMQGPTIGTSETFINSDLMTPVSTRRTQSICWPMDSENSKLQASIVELREKGLLHFKNCTMPQVLPKLMLQLDLKDVWIIDLALEKCKIRILPGFLHQLKGLERLSLKGNYLTEFYDEDLFCNREIRLKC
jgi:hypothetical protein